MGVWKCSGCGRTYDDHAYSYMYDKLEPIMSALAPKFNEQRIQLGYKEAGELTGDFLTRELLKAVFMCAECFDKLDTKEPFNQFVEEMLVSHDGLSQNLNIFEWKEITP